MKQKFLLLILTALLVSCKDSPKQETNSTKPKNTNQEAKNTVSKVADSSKTAVYFIKSKKTAATNELRKYITEKIESVESVDFTGDKVPDYICKTTIDTLGIGNEYWISSEYKTIKKVKYYGDGFSYRWFINLDHDPEPEMFVANGDEDGADYTIMDQNLVSGKDSILLYINPVLIENQKKYWGYPWDIQNIIARKNGSNIELFCSLNHQIIRDGNEESDPEFQKQMPVLFFTGHHTQESGKMGIKDEKWLSLQEIIKQSKR
ncbi:hypothetical protein ASF10_11590 [Flavobacterium sp. Leaf82]|uniref:hypothetical protein n=1 Tax=unclassified Flavobacterium TaxID=196869 RepID=UPI0006F6DE02|nr:hypothetical protein [Flavobacterium sp. Leaf82]KQO22980.1 hypothetical protein ASF10_11590 [Flavobacterium sp. Leaf82]